MSKACIGFFFSFSQRKGVVSIQNDYRIYEQLCKISSIASLYPNGQPFAGKVRETADRIASQLYRVAVIGEFKRGKSSLVNALLGTDVLPTDILPMTAVITRVTYGESKKISVRYKDGHTEERTVEQLIDFATKYDEAKAQTAKSIQEIQVSYPSVFCKNHIEIIDTPGMNDDEAMTAVTLSVLGEIDAAVMVVSAAAPLSMTERSLVLTMIAEQGIRHIVFVITHIDVVSDEEEEKDRLLSFFGNRIRGDLLQDAEKRFCEDEDLLNKARNILKDPDVFGVSSVQAMKGFVKDDEALLKQSRFPQFKKSLLTLLTAAQSTDSILKLADAAKDIQNHLDVWYQSARQDLENRSAQILLYREQYQQYFQNSKNHLLPLLLDMDAHLQAASAPNRVTTAGSAADTVRKIFIRHLSALRKQDDTHSAVLHILQNACAEAEAYLQQEAEQAKDRVHREMQTVYTAFSKSRPVYAASDTETQYAADLNRNLAVWQENTPFPVFHWYISPIPALDDLTAVDIMPHIQSAVTASLEKYQTEIERYIASWRVVLLQRNQALIADTSVLNLLEKHKEETASQKNLLSVQYTMHKAQLEEIAKQLSADAEL